MHLWEMSLSGAVMIIAIVAVRVAAINKLPKRVFILLWEAVLLRLLIPFSIPSALSVYSFMRKNIPTQKIFVESPSGNTVPQVVAGQIDINADVAGVLQNDKLGLSIWCVLWIAGVLLCIAIFVITYLKCYSEFKTSLPVRNEFVLNWLGEHRLKRSIQIRQSDRISAPLTYGIINPVILMPKKTDWENNRQLQYVLQHEYVHICRFDMVIKLLSAFALCIHWFNPFVWGMYVLFNRDMELLCDEIVVQHFGEDSKAAYARTLINMEEKKSGLTPFCNNFSKNAMEERLTAIMKMKKTTIGALIFSVAIAITIVALFATSAEKKSTDELQQQSGMEQAELKNIMVSFYKAYFAGDMDGIKVYLADSFDGDVEVYNNPELAEKIEIKRIKGMDHVTANDENILSLEFVGPEEDSYSYLTVKFIKEEGSQRIGWYGLEK